MRVTVKLIGSISGVSEGEQSTTLIEEKRELASALLAFGRRDALMKVASAYESLRHAITGSSSSSSAATSAAPVLLPIPCERVQTISVLAATRGVPVDALLRSAPGLSSIHEEEVSTIDIASVLTALRSRDGGKSTPNHTDGGMSRSAHLRADTPRRTAELALEEWLASPLMEW